MRYILFLLLICSTAHAQTYRAATTTSTAAPISYTQTGVDTLINRLTRRVAALENFIASLPSIRRGAWDSTQNINPLFTAVNSQLTTLRNQQASIGSTLTIVQRQVSDLQTANSNNTAAISVAQTQITSLQQNFNTFQGQVKMLSEQLNMLQIWADRIKLISFQ